nr:MAG TPA: hypothetical protein [Caudoviricetes sp.]
MLSHLWPFLFSLRIPAAIARVRFGVRGFFPSKLSPLFLAYNYNTFEMCLSIHSSIYFF